jgi:hypothetical protein
VPYQVYRRSRAGTIGEILQGALGVRRYNTNPASRHRRKNLKDG